MTGPYGTHAHERLIAHYRALQTADMSLARRGRAFERLVANLFTLGKLNVVHNPGGAAPRQTDLIAT